MEQWILLKQNAQKKFIGSSGQQGSQPVIQIGGVGMKDGQQVGYSHGQTAHSSAATTGNFSSTLMV